MVQIAHTIWNVSCTVHDRDFLTKPNYVSQAGLDRLMMVGYIPKLQAKTASTADTGNRPEVRTLSTTRRYDNP